MILRNESLKEALAAEYVLGTLQGRARTRFEQLLNRDASLQGHVGFWEEAFQPMADNVPDVQPPSSVWNNIQTRLGLNETEVKQPSTPGMSWWRGAWVSFALVALLTTILVFGPVEEVSQFTPDIEVALVNKKDKPVWVVDADSAHDTVVVKTVRKVVVPDDKSLELWLVLESGESPISLGLMPTGEGQEYTVTSSVPLNEGVGFAVSLEPKGGSPTGVATGPILYIQMYKQG